MKDLYFESKNGNKTARVYHSQGLNTENQFCVHFMFMGSTDWDYEHRAKKFHGTVDTAIKAAKRYVNQ